MTEYFAGLKMLEMSEMIEKGQYVRTKNSKVHLPLENIQNRVARHLCYRFNSNVQVFLLKLRKTFFT